MKKAPKQEDLPKRYMRWNIVSVFLLCVGLMFLIEALSRLDLKAFEGLKFSNLSYLIPFIACLSCWCIYMAKGREYSKKGFRWVNVAIVLLSIALMFLFEEMATVGSDIFGTLNFFFLALTSWVLFSLSAICTNYAKQYK